MSTGSADGYFEFFPRELIPDGLQLVFDVWRKLPSSSKIGKEDKITGRLTAAMKREKKARKLGFSIHFQVIPLGPDEPVAARIDFKFLAGFDEDSYFAFECKRLRIPGGSRLNHNTGSYVGAQGMGRFIIGKYAPTQNHGAMIGYVMDGNLTEAKSSLISLIQTRKSELKLVGNTAWGASSFLPKESDIHETRHSLKTKEFTLQHLFLAV